MPELPEVETIVRQLDKALTGKVVKGVEVLRKKSFEGVSDEMVGKKVRGVWRKSKMIVIEFVPTKGRGSDEKWNKVVLIHLKMTGQLVLVNKKKRLAGGHPTADWVNELPSKHTRVIISFGSDLELFFNDMRIFGWIKVKEEEVWKEEMEKLPPDVIDEAVTLQLFKELIIGSMRPIKQVLMDQKKIGGVGNIYANDGLFLARINPTKPANSLDDKEIKSLWRAIRKVVNRGIVLGGASYSDYKDVHGLGGKYQEHFLVYGRDGEKCSDCGVKLRKFKLGGRGTYWCPGCQMR
jgi:formamidopyrimidine-DNA glycosylase